MTDDVSWRPSGELSLAPRSLVRLEEALGPEDVLAVAELPGETFAVLNDPNDTGDRLVVRLRTLDPPTWTEISRHDYWAIEADCAAGALAQLVDDRRNEIRIPSEERIEPVIVVPCRNGIEVLSLTPTGVAFTTQLFQSPDDLLTDADRWKSFDAAMHWLTLEL